MRKNNGTFVHMLCMLKNYHEINRYKFKKRKICKETLYCEDPCTKLCISLSKENHNLFQVLMSFQFKEAELHSQF